MFRRLGKQWQTRQVYGIYAKKQALWLRGPDNIIVVLDGLVPFILKAVPLAGYRYR